ncbi:uncharacterized protein LOC113921520 [Zalophus californianus]|uniref:Uncharacterized protein LOC113921520 n=1 Tax=Zalophus californianus TaxID=9704 RepID=A0A6J2CXI7_ZALCA|nr:uncharacterized protein LOC113921520 [Zalophus californianus]
MPWLWARSCGRGKEELGLGAGLSHAHPRSARSPSHSPPVSGRRSGVYLFTSGLRQLLPLFPVSASSPCSFFPPPSGSESAASQWCDLRIGCSRPSYSSYATSFPRRYKSYCTAPVSLRPSELEMQLLGASEAGELGAEAAGEVRAM